MSESYPITPELLDDLFSIQYLIVFNGSGIALVSIDVGKINVPDLLISGLLQAILAMIKELKPKSEFSVKEDRINVHEISESEHGFIIYFCQGLVEDQKIILAVVCSRKCSLVLKKRLKEALTVFLMTFGAEIKRFDGSIYPFTERGTELLNEFFGLTFLNPFKLNPELLSKHDPLTPEYSQIIALIKNLYLDLELVEGEGVFLRELVDIGMRSISLPYLNLLSTIIDMVMIQLLIPAKEQVFLAGGKQLEPRLQHLEVPSPEPFTNLPVKEPALHETIAGTITPVPSENVLSDQELVEKGLSTPSVPEHVLPTGKADSGVEGQHVPSPVQISQKPEEPLPLTPIEPGLQQDHNKPVIAVPDAIENELEQAVSWYKDFKDQILSMTTPDVKTLNLIESSMIREIEYKREYKFSKKISAPGTDLTSVINVFKYYKMIKKGTNIFQGPLLILQENEKLTKVCLSAVKLQEQVVVIIFK